MKIFVKAKPGSKQERIEKIQPTLFLNSFANTADAHFIVFVKEPPAQGRANMAIIRALAEYFKVPPSRLRLVSGFSSREKLFELL